jgi:aconitate decarboxylase
VTSAHLLKLSIPDTLSAVGTAATQAAGLWQFLLDATHSKQVHTAKACFDGVFAAYVAQSKLLGPSDVLEGEKGMAASLVPGEPNPQALDRQLGTKYSILESSFKWHASCRHTHPSVDAILSIMQHNSLNINDVRNVVCHTYRAAIDILTRSEKAETVHQSKFSMGFVLAVAAKYGRATVLDFTEQALDDVELRSFQRRVKMTLDAEIEAAFPEKWQGRVDIVTKSGKTFSEMVDVVKGDPGKSLTRQVTIVTLLAQVVMPANILLLQQR